MKAIRIGLIAVFCFLSCEKLYSQEIIIEPEYTTYKLPFGMTERLPTQYPYVGLALSGGGSRGLSQIGVLKAIEEANIPIRLIVGTSMGSIVGGLYSLGYSINELDSIARNTDWDELLAVDKRINRRELFVDQKVTEDKAVFTLRLRGLRPVLPTSINDGQKLTNYLNLLTYQGPGRNYENFDDLAIPFRAVCTNLKKGEPVVLGKGSLAQALRASSSVSFLLSPITLDSLLLVDGGLTANIPVKITKELGADFVIAINTTSDLHPEEELELPWVVADQVVSIPMKLLNEIQLKEANAIIQPQLYGKASTDFSQIDSLIAIGYEAGKQKSSEIKQQLDSIFFSRLQKKEVFIKNPVINEESGIGRMYLHNYINRDSISSAEILRDLYEINATGKYDSIYARITPVNGKNIIRFEGKLAPTITSVQYSGINILNPDTISSLIGTITYKTFEPRRVVTFIKSVIDLYRNSGYSLAELESSYFDRNTGVLFLKFNEGVIDSIIVEGNESSNTTIITRELPFQAGSIYTYEAVQRGLSNLRNTNLFDNVFIKVKKVGTKNIVFLSVDEKNSSLARLGFKIANENYPQLNIDIRDENIFGTGTELGLLVYLSQRGRSFIAEHKENRICKTYLTDKSRDFYHFDDIFTYKDDIPESDDEFSRSISGEYRQRSYGLSFSLGTQVGKFGNLIFTGRYGMNGVRNLRENTTKETNERLVSLKVATTIDTQDKYPYPTDGIRLHGFYELSSSVLGSETGFTNIGGEYKGYITIKDKHTIITGFRIGAADKTLPLYLQYSLGGQYSFFGMRENEFRGRQVFQSSLEYRLMLPVRLFFDTYFMVRYDLGSIWEVQEQIRFADFRHGLGTTLSFDTPIGPADFSIGRSFLFVKGLPDNPLRLGPLYFYFSLGYYY